jgi:hypothetical protein
MPRYLGQVVAIEGDVRKSTARQLTDAHHALQKQAMLEGISREYQPRFEDGEQLPPEHGRVQATVKEMVDATRDALVRLFDATAARDYTNGPGGPAEATADVKVDGEVLIPKAPVPYLLWLEKRLDDLETFARKLPTHDPATDWTLESPRGVWKATPVQTARTVQVPRANVIVPATPQHPAQVQSYAENVVAGTWTTTKKTGAIPVAQQAELLDRIQKLQRAVHVAREEANRAEAIEPQIGARVLEYLFG